MHLKSAALLPRTTNYASRAQGKLSLRGSSFHCPVQHASALSALHVLYLPQGGWCGWINQPRGARAHAPNHQGEGRHLVRKVFILEWVTGLTHISPSPSLSAWVREDRIYKAVLHRDTPEEKRAVSERHFCSKCSAMLWLWDETWCAPTLFSW